MGAPSASCRPHLVGPPAAICTGNASPDWRSPALTSSRAGPHLVHGGRTSKRSGPVSLPPRTRGSPRSVPPGAAQGRSFSNRWVRRQMCSAFAERPGCLASCAGIGAGCAHGEVAIGVGQCGEDPLGHSPVRIKAPALGEGRPEPSELLGRRRCEPSRWRSPDEGECARPVPLGNDPGIVSEPRLPRGDRGILF